MMDEFFTDHMTTHLQYRTGCHIRVHTAFSEDSLFQKLNVLRVSCLK